MRTRTGAGVVAGVVAGAVMATAVMAVMAATGKSVWTNPNLIAAMWLGPEVVGGGLSWATALGFVTHMATSALMGWVALPFIRELPRWRTVLVATVYAVASYPIVFVAVMRWADPIMYERAQMVLMTPAHVLFGLVLGLVYIWLRPPDRAEATEGAKPSQV